MPRQTIFLGADFRTVGAVCSSTRLVVHFPIPLVRFIMLTGQAESSSSTVLWALKTWVVCRSSFFSLKHVMRRVGFLDTRGVFAVFGRPRVLSSSTGKLWWRTQGEKMIKVAFFARSCPRRDDLKHDAWREPLTRKTEMCCSGKRPLPHIRVP